LFGLQGGTMVFRGECKIRAVSFAKVDAADGGKHSAVGKADEDLARVIDDGNFENVSRGSRGIRHDGDRVAGFEPTERERCGHEISAGKNELFQANTIARWIQGKSSANSPGLTRRHLVCRS
jgi:hypothetical protein